uniref:Doublecortin domain-containing protein n=1 Tax=Myripristis murdjan TaxID=586833 RepID=A0A667YGN2_9TELE
NENLKSKNLKITLSSGSLQTLGSRPLQPISDPSASKRVCFYKSGDNKFSGHRMIINTRTFKTFDALLDALSKKVPLPFGVRTIGTPRGIHLVKGLDDLHDGGSYVCSDQRRVKPLNLDAVRQRQVPWNTTRPVTKVPERVAVRTPKRLVVIKNKDPTIRRTVVLQRRTAPTFDALLDYLSEIMQFPVLKLFSADGRRVSTSIYVPTTPVIPGVHTHTHTHTRTEREREEFSPHPSAWTAWTILLTILTTLLYKEKIYHLVTV